MPCRNSFPESWEEFYSRMKLAHVTNVEEKLKFDRVVELLLKNMGFALSYACRKEY